MQPVWKVFVPHNIFLQPDSVLFGHVTPSSQSVYIVASTPDITTVTTLPADLQHIGTLKSLKTGSQKCRHVHKPVWVDISTSRTADISCYVYLYGTVINCTCIIYDPSELLKSDVLCEKALMDTEHTDNVTSLVKVLKTTCMGTQEGGAGLKTFVHPSLCQQKLREVTRVGLSFLVLFLHFPFRWCQRHIRVPVLLTPVSGTLSALSQLATRAADVSQMDRRTSQTPVNRLRMMDCCVRQVLDSLLGLTLMYFLMTDSRAQHVANILLSYGDTVAREMKQLLDWLMGAPAGLKLNSNLTHFLGKFFQYHIYLWTGYLSFLTTVLGHLVYYSSVAGVWGASLQLALFQDIFSTLTLHIYCFYVYAARLYRLQVYALSSLWRLFRGKKWNVLRQRVDSSIYDADQLFVGTLLFTVLLFILPTTGLYYLVFTLLRLLILSIQGVVSYCRQVLNTLPVWSGFLWGIGSPAFTDGAVFNIVSQPKHNSSSQNTGTCLLVSMQCKRLALNEVLSVTRSNNSSKATYSIGRFVSKLFVGELVYPWFYNDKLDMAAKQD